MKLGTVARYRSQFLLLTGVLTGLVLGGLSVGLLLDYRFAERYVWLSFLTLGCWLLLAVQAFLAVVVMVRRLLGRRWVSALSWLLLAGLGAVREFWALRCYPWWCCAGAASRLENRH